MATVLRKLVLQPGIYVVRRVWSADQALTLEQIDLPAAQGALDALCSAAGPGMTLRTPDDCVVLQVSTAAVAIQASADVPADTAPPQLRVDRIGPAASLNALQIAPQTAPQIALDLPPAKARSLSRARGPAPTATLDSPPIVSAPLSDDAGQSPADEGGIVPLGWRGDDDAGPAQPAHANADSSAPPPVVIIAPGATMPDPTADPNWVDRIVIGTASQDPLIVANPQPSPTVIGGSGTVVINNDPYQVVQTGGSATHYTVGTSGGHAVVTNNPSGQASPTGPIQYGPGVTPPPPSPSDPASVTMMTMYRVMFGTETSVESLAYWIGMLQGGIPLQAVADALVNTQDFRAMYDGSPDDVFVRALYAHSFNYPADEQGVRYWIDTLRRGQMTRAAVIVAFTYAAEPRPAAGPSDTPMVVLTSEI